MALASSSSNLATRLLPQRLPRVCLAISGDTVEDQIAIAESMAHAAGCQIVDLELQSAAKAKPDAIARLRSRAGLILSFHDFRATRNLDETLEKMLRIPADFYKIVTTATTLSDNVVMMKFLQTQSDRHALVG